MWSCSRSCKKDEQEMFSLPAMLPTVRASLTQEGILGEE